MNQGFESVIEEKPVNNWKVYLIQCCDNTLYCGVTNKAVSERVNVHNSGKGSKYTSGRRPVKLIAYSSDMSRSEALKLEYKIKQLPRAKKIDAIKDLIPIFFP